MSRLANLSLANRIVVALLTALIAVAGIISLNSLKQELIPSIEIPAAAVVASYPGASPEVVDDQVSRPLENAIIGLEGLESTTVTSSQGLSLIRVSFEFGTTTDDVVERLNNALNAISDTLPEDVSPQVISGSFDSVPIIVLAVSEDNGDNESIAAALNDTAPSLFSSVDGVRDVAVSGFTEKRVNLDLNQIALAQNGLSQQNIIQALEQNGLVLPVGSITDDEGTVSVQIGSEVSTIAALESLPLISQAQLASGNTNILTLGDVASISYEDAPVTSIARTNGNESLAIAITKTPDGNSVDVSHGVSDLIPELEEALGGNVTVVTTLDQAPFIEKSIEDLTVEGLLGLTFAVLVILVFLLSIKSTVITAISIPTSLLITFIGLQVWGFSLNILTLGALTIAIGRVVDDSIVVIENINRHLSYGAEKISAIKTAVKEVAGAITASTITTAAVFLPIALVGGIVGELFRPFAFTVSFALLASLLVSLTIVPVLAYWFLGMPKRVKKAFEENSVNFEARQRELEEEREKKNFLQRGYVPILTTTTNHPWVTIVSALLILGFTVSLVPQLRTDFLDGGGSNQFSVSQTLKNGSTLAQQDEAAKKLEELILDIEGVEVVQTTVGSAADGRVAFGAAAEGIQMQVTISEDSDVDEVQAELNRLAAADESLGEVAASSQGPGFGSSDTIDIQITSPNEQDLQQAVDGIVAATRDLSYVATVTTSLAAAERVLEIEVDREAAAQLGLSEIAVSGIVAQQMRPQPLGTINIEGRDSRIFVTGQEAPTTAAEVEALLIPTAAGPVALSTIANVEQVLKPTEITSERGERTATVSIASDFNDLGAVTEQIQTAIDGVELPSATTASLGGVAADQAESFEQLGLALLAAIAIVYVVMVATFGSLIQPLILLVSIPFAATGALLMLLVTDIALAVPSLIGMLLLIGIVVTNAIVLIDLINQYRKQGRSVQDAMLNGARQRLRPILMTALATIFALTPMAMGLTGGSGFISQPLAVVVIGGLFSSTILTLILVPVLYWLVEGRKERKVIRLQNRELRKQRKALKSARFAAVSE